MTFLQPWLLAALPLVALPVIIHLINQRRYQSVPWAAMMFLLAAKQMSRGYARLRQWLILMLRVAAILTLVLAVSRPLTSGWLGAAAASRTDTTIVLLDRSPSMQQTTAGGQSVLQQSLGQLAETLRTLGTGRLVVIDSVGVEPRSLDSVDRLLQPPQAAAAANTSDIPALLATARDYIHDNRPGPTDVWIVSDLQASDWDSQGSRWQTLRDDFLALPQSIRFHLLTAAGRAQDNLAIRVTDARLLGGPSDSAAGNDPQLSLSLSVTRQGPQDSSDRVPVGLQIDSVRSVVEVELAGGQAELRDHQIPLAGSPARGWGAVTIPADSNPADNTFYFVYEVPPPRHSVIVADDAAVAEVLEVAATVAPDPETRVSAEVVPHSQLATVDWDQLAMLLWHGPLPEGPVADEVDALVLRGGRAIFFPSPDAAGGSLLGLGWEHWIEDAGEAPIARWRNDIDLLANTASGAALPVGDIKLRRRMSLADGDFTPLATLADDQPLVGRRFHGDGAIYFCGTNPTADDSSLAADGVVFYVMVQRALAAGSGSLGSAHQLDATPMSLTAPRSDPTPQTAPRSEPNSPTAPPSEPDSPTTPRSTPDQPWRRLAGPEEARSDEYPAQAGVYEVGSKLLAINRPAQEDAFTTVSDQRLGEMFGELDFVRVDLDTDGQGGLVREVWRLFVIAMIAAMIFEAGLSMPRMLRREAV